MREKRLAERVGFELAGYIHNSQLTVFLKAQKRKRRLKRQLEVHGGYTDRRAHQDSFCNTLPSSKSVEVSFGNESVGNPGEVALPEENSRRNSIANSWFTAFRRSESHQP